MKIKIYEFDHDKEEELLSFLPNITTINTHHHITGIYREYEIEVGELKE